MSASIPKIVSPPSYRPGGAGTLGRFRGATSESAEVPRRTFGYFPELELDAPAAEPEAPVPAAAAPGEVLSTQSAGIADLFAYLDSSHRDSLFFVALAPSPAAAMVELGALLVDADEFAGAGAEAAEPSVVVLLLGEYGEGAAPGAAVPGCELVCELAFFSFARSPIARAEPLAKAKTVVSKRTGAVLRMGVS